MSLSIDTVNTINGGGASALTGNDAASADRFLKLLVAQMQNQDPLNPLDNAQVTTQMAQISTVEGIAKLDTTMKSMNAQFVQLQALQGASLVGRDVTVAGDRLAEVGGKGQAGFELSGPADAVKVEVLNAGGHVVDTLDLGALPSGRHAFEWDGADAADHRFRVVAHNGAAQVAAAPLMLDRVRSVSFGGDTLNLELARAGNVPYAAIVAFN